ncbi:MAG TPA: DUF6658 family protein [Coleofasciculaceae cyanobacterium]|jgi:hypothetical protein
MKRLTNFFKQLRFSQILTVFLATVVLFMGTACNSGDVRGARPDNPPVQMGGSNNPYKSGGDTNTNYNTSPDPKVSGKSNKSADLHIISNQLIASQETLYPGADKQLKRPEVEKALPKITLEDFETSEPGGQIQREGSIGERIQDRLSTVKETVDKASEFLNEGADKALEGNEKVDNPGLPFLKR